MPGPLYNLFSAGDQVEFESDYSLAESVQRLQDVTRVLSPAIRGRVAETYVSIHRPGPPVWQEVRPWFFGRFHERNGRVVLRGGYSMHDGIKVFMAVWLLGCTIALWLSIRPAIVGESSIFLPLVPLGLLAGAVLTLWFGQRMTRDDPAWISDVITRTLKLPH
jgi:hypothetical protein